MQTIWLSPTDFVTDDPTLRISHPFVSHPSAIVTCTAPGDLKWVSMGLRLLSDVQIEEVIICYEVSNARSFISQIMLAEMTTPDKATVIHDDPTHLTSTTPATHSSTASGLVPFGAVTLGLRLSFQDTSDEIQLGAVGVKIRASGERCVNSMGALKELHAGAFHCVQLLGYYSPGDGGGGEFYWDASSTEPDNRGTIIIPAVSSAPGRWKRVVEGPLSVKWFGATGDGHTPDTPAINKCISIAAALGASVYLSQPRVFYKCTENVIVPSNTIIEGTGANCTLTFTGPSALTLSKKALNIRLENFQVHSDDSACLYGIHLDENWFVTLDKIRISAVDGAMTTAGLFIEANFSEDNANCAQVNCYDLNVTGPAGDCVQIYDEFGVASVNFFGGNLSDATAWGINQKLRGPTNGPSQFHCYSTLIENNAAGQVNADAAGSAGLFGCHLENNQQSSNPPLVFANGADCSVNGLSVVDCQVTGGNAANLIKILNGGSSFGVTVQGCVFYGYFMSAIYVHPINTLYGLSVSRCGDTQKLLDANSNVRSIHVDHMDTDGIAAYGSMQHDLDMTAVGTTSFWLGPIPVDGQTAFWAAQQILMTGTLSTPQSLIVPLNSGWLKVIVNSTGVSITVKGSSGGGTTIANGKSAFVRCGGADIVRVTPDT